MVLPMVDNSSGGAESVLCFVLFSLVGKKNLTNFSLYEPRHEISNNVVCATSKASDQPAQMCSLIRAFSRRWNIL